MKQYIFWIVPFIIFIIYKKKYVKKAEAEIQKFNILKDMETKQTQQLEFLKVNVFNGLKNLNQGFDAEEIYYFSESDFEIVLDRVEKIGIGILGIEPWLNEKFYNVKSFDDYSNDCKDPKWYRKAFTEFKEDGEKNLLYAASYQV
ncbi:hypothetical protein [Flavobacterium chungangense]|uniref:Uncharacterized protein n=1 Tax=Flavobacterium chungangense TaxID=554283 RepID=A0A6V6ZDV0_9FLAO|nr:hypothetical protein [Flavobacterium chungangense]CAD0009726.1 hypothetical protein FLACHUCJ7_04390 [Flavobacterium chungangense]